MRKLGSRLTFGLLIALLWLLLAAETVLAGSSEGGFSSFRHEAPSLSLHQFIVGPACLSLATGPLDLDCNPAFLAMQSKRQLRLNLASNDQLGAVNDYREKLANNDSIGIVNKVLEKREPVLARAAASVWYQRDWWALGYVPFRGGFASSYRNPAYPTIQADIFKESEWFAKVGLLTADDAHLHVGFQLRYVESTFFRRQFDLLDVIGDPANLKIDKQRVLYLEPGLTYSFAENPWDSMISASITQAAVYQDGKTSSFYPVLDMGFSVSPPFLGRKLRTSTHFNNNPDVADLFARFRWVAMYDFEDVASVSVALGKNLAGIGVNGHLQSVVLGVGVKTEDVSLDRSQSTRVSTFLFEAGLVF